MSNSEHNLVIPDEIIMNKIYLIRGQKVMIDSDLAELYGVETKRLNEQVKRNANRFPLDFMFELTETEFKNLKSQIATSSIKDLQSNFTPIFITPLLPLLPLPLRLQRGVNRNSFLTRGMQQVSNALGKAFLLHQYYILKEGRSPDVFVEK